MIFLQGLVQCQTVADFGADGAISVPTHQAISRICLANRNSPSYAHMPIKYTKPDPTDDVSGNSARAFSAQRRFRRYASAPPSRRALTWIIIGTALIVTVLMMVSELPYLDSTALTPEDIWLHGTVISNDFANGKRVLRVELPGSEDTPAHIYDISLDDRAEWATIQPDDDVRIQVRLDDEGNIKQITGVESSGDTPRAAASSNDETVPD